MIEPPPMPTAVVQRTTPEASRMMVVSMRQLLAAIVTGKVSRIVVPANRRRRRRGDAVVEANSPAHTPTSLSPSRHSRPAGTVNEYNVSSVPSLCVVDTSEYQSASR